MARQIQSLMVLILLFSSLAACGAGDETLLLSAANSGEEVAVDTGDQFEVRLESNPSTGYEWQINPLSLQFIALVSSTFEAAEGDLVGAPGTAVFVFSADEPGAEILRLEYVRPFDDPIVPERIVEYIVRVDGVPFTSGSDDPPTTSTATVPDPDPGGVIDVTELFDGEGPRDATVRGYLLWDTTSARLCEVLMESFPPQCGGLWVVIANPAALNVATEETQGVRWTDSFVELQGSFDGDRFILDEDAATTEPTETDLALAEVFLAYVAEPTAETAAALPFAETVSLGIGDQILRTITAAERADPLQWSLEMEEYEGYGGPFSALDLASDPAVVTIGDHPRCAAAPVPAPGGFETLRRVSIQPETATSCLEWWTVDFYVDTDGIVQAVTLDLFGP